VLAGSLWRGNALEVARNTAFKEFWIPGHFGFIVLGSHARQDQNLFKDGPFQKIYNSWDLSILVGCLDVYCGVGRPKMVRNLARKESWISGHFSQCVLVRMQGKIKPAPK
jgi:hypothetical protein